ncbi:methyltransferase [Massilia sp. R2A-15]|uniref:class I SAM-dependent methyltransferase n=1 Tax=Massilia sp. R2A-15 TaxID=3064278 RepID=UPI002735716F|nr:methyltransferase [Massilia sp. R2A-15]WLI89362.1 methyltransferase [Massilia sp. R2A-15]
MKRLILAAMLAAGLCGGAQAADDALKTAIASSTRLPANVARDGARHPYETLSFFGIKPTMTVVELTPEGGWYTEILAPYLRDHGVLIGAGDEVKPQNRYGMMFMKKVNSNPVYDKVRIGIFEPPVKYAIAPANSVDMVLTFRNMHNWVELGDDKLQEALKNVYTVLKPGGVFGVVDHRLPASMTQDATASTGYLHEAWVIKTVEAAGFKLVAKSDINANPKDNANHPKGVWALPPTLANKDDKRADYIAIGESDRMTLKFVKP